jgi:hypothetical protein
VQYQTDEDSARLAGDIATTIFTVSFSWIGADNPMAGGGLPARARHPLTSAWSTWDRALIASGNTSSTPMIAEKAAACSASRSVRAWVAKFNIRLEILVDHHIMLFLGLEQPGTLKHHYREHKISYSLAVIARVALKLILIPPFNARHRHDGPIRRTNVRPTSVSDMFRKPRPHAGCAEA